MKDSDCGSVHPAKCVGCGHGAAKAHEGKSMTPGGMAGATHEEHRSLLGRAKDALESAGDRAADAVSGAATKAADYLLGK